MYNTYTGKDIRIVSLNEGIEINELLRKKGVVYLAIPDIPIREGIVKMNIGHALEMTLGNRFNSHLLNNFGDLRVNKTDKEMCGDIDEVLYLKVLAEGIEDKYTALKLESLFTAQEAYNLCPRSDKMYCDIVHIINRYDNVKKHMYNKLINQTHQERKLWDYKDIQDIINGKYTPSIDIESDLYRVGALSLARYL